MSEGKTETNNTISIKELNESIGFVVFYLCSGHLKHVHFQFFM